MQMAEEAEEEVVSGKWLVVSGENQVEKVERVQVAEEAEEEVVSG